MSALALDRALARAASGRALDAAQAEALLGHAGRAAPRAARGRRRRSAIGGHGRRLTFSAKVFVPLTKLCRDYCGYCTFRRIPASRARTP